jgi:cell division septation protein DedD
MIKYLFIVINALTVFLYSLFGGDGAITITNTIPKTISPGKEVPIEIKITKGTMSGFAKFQLDVPEGLSIKEIDSRGANFTFADGIAKWVWSSLPSDNDVVIKATLVAASAANGSKTIGGKYSYVENNAKQVVEMAPVEIAVGSGENITSTSNTNTTTATETVKTTSTESTTTPTASSNPNSEPNANINVVRTIEKKSETEYTVNLKIKKGATKGFARYSDDLPENLTAKSSKTDGSSFSVADGKIKFVWVNVPDKEEMDINYTISASGNTTVTLNGEYSFLEENQSKKYKLQPESIVFVGTQTASVAVTTPTIEISNKTNTTTVAETKTETAVAEKTTSTNTATTEATNTNTTTETITKTEGNVNYMVQIGAFTNSGVTSSTLARKFNVTETIKSEMQGGFSKFMIGNYAEYKAARDRREGAKNNNNIKSAFVVAYNGPKRITVQEALMISNQKWFK